MKKKGLALLAAAVARARSRPRRRREAAATRRSPAPAARSCSPLVSAWTPALGTAFDYTVQYSAVGSGAGIAAITNRTVDFGASDAPLTPDQSAGVQRLRPDPVGARRHRDRVQRPGRARRT